MDIGAISVGGIIVLIINGGVMWIREFKRHRGDKKNGSTLEDVHHKISDCTTDIQTTKEAAIRTEEQVKALVSHCTQTTARFNGAIVRNQEAILKIASRKD